MATTPEPREGATREPLVGSDPLGLTGTTPPDAPSRHPRPRILALLGEFFRMSRATAILLVAFVLIGLLYVLVRENPVVGFGPPAPVSSTPTAPATSGDEPTGEESTGEESTGTAEATTAPTGTTVPTGTTGATPTGAPTGTADGGTQQSAEPTATTVDPGAGGGDAGAGLRQEPQGAPGDEVPTG